MSLSDEERKVKLAELTAEHDLDTKKIILNLLQQQLAQDGLTTTELNYLLQKGAAWGIYSDTVVTEAQAAIQEVQAINDAINTIPADRTFTMSVAVLGAENVSGLGAGFGASQWTGKKRAGGGPVAAGEAYLVGENGPELFVSNTSGAIIPNSGTSSTASAGGGGAVSISLVISSPVTILDEERTKTVLLPYIVDGVKQAQARGVLR